MSKVFSFIPLFFLSVMTYAQQKPGIEWHTFSEVISLVEEKPKMVLVNVYVDWCSWCKKMEKETFTDQEVIDYINENFYPVKINGENTAEKYEFRGEKYTDASMARAMRATSYPNFVVMDAAMENITLMPGYRNPESFLTSLGELLDEFNP